MPIQGPVVVVGATGTVGRRIVDKLVAKGVQVRAIARDLSALRGRKNVEAVEADLTRREEAERALRGARTVYLTPPETGEDPLAIETAVGENVIRAAKQAGVQHVIMHTALHADRGDTGVRMLDNKSRLERKLKESGVPYTILRPGWFLQNLLTSRTDIQGGVLRMPIPSDRRIAVASAEDVASAAIGFLEKGPQNRGFDLHVEDGSDCGELCSALATARGGKQVSFEEFTGPSRSFAEEWPISEVHKDLYGELFDYFRAADYLGRPEDLPRALPTFRYTAPEQFARSELFAARPAAAPR